ncbi:DNA polymerase III subunit epsilon [Galenea microaerophila]
MRQIVLDTETTGLHPHEGHRILEIGAVEVVKRKLTGEHYHQYINPQRDVPQEVVQVHGITEEFLADKPTFAEIVDEFMAFVSGAELLIHNAPFDVGFINHELSLLQHNPWGKLEDHCTITDTLKMAQKIYPGQRNTLDALCRRLGINNSHRELHGALLDSEILADVYLAMTGGQTALFDGVSESTERVKMHTQRTFSEPLPVIQPTPEELSAHQAYLQKLNEISGQPKNW